MLRGTESDGVTPVWKDLLTSYNGNTITYDAIGNPLNWPGIANLSWSNGRRLTSMRRGRRESRIPTMIRACGR